MSTTELFQTSSSSLPSITGGFANLGRRTGLAFSGGKTGAPGAGLSVAGGTVVDVVVVGASAGLTSGELTGVADAL
ncbi:MAG TPA: hypothetical protein VJT50_00365, partial [Pyrinomonadaceae bacterium]|nr:hypothetical protein [Pyrinomonadaceae bacterium]